MKYVFIVTYGRSGSTLLQGILNASEQIHCSGENGDFLFGLFQSIRILEKTKKMVGPNKGRSPKDPFFGIDYIDEGEIFDSFRELVSKQILNSCPSEKSPNFVGYKEIRYPFKENLEEYLEFINELFEEPKILFLFRDLDNVLNSGMFMELSDDARNTNRKQFRNFETVALKFSERRENCAIIRYENFKANPEKIHAQIEKIGLPVAIEELYETIKTPHSYVWKDQNV